MRKAAATVSKRKIVAVFCLSLFALVGLVGVITNLSASADEAYIIKMPNAHVVDPANPTNEAVWDFGNNESVILDIQTSDNNPTVTPSNGVQASFSGGGNDAKANFRGLVSGDICNVYEFEFREVTDTNPFTTIAACNYDSSTDKSAISFASTVGGLPGNSVELLVNKRQSQPTENSFTIFYDSVTTGSTENKVNIDVDGTVVGVTLTGMTFDSTTEKSVADRDALFGSTPTAYFTVDENFNSETMQLAISGSDNYHSALTVNNSIATLAGVNVPGDSIHFGIEPKGGQTDPDDPPHPGQRTTANVTLTSSDAAHRSSYAVAGIRINGEGIDIGCDLAIDPDCSIPETLVKDDFEFNYDAENDSGVVTFTFGTVFDHRFVGNIIITGADNTILKTINVADAINYADKLSCLTHTQGQEILFETTVPLSTEYHIVADVEDNPETNTCIANFLWTSNEEAKGTDEYIGHSRLELLSVEWTPIGGGDKIVISKEDFNKPLTEAQKNAGMVIDFFEGDEHSPGSLVISADAVVTMGIVPEYGYQVTGFGVNEAIVTTGEEISQFTFPVGTGNFHIGAEVTKTEDLVASNTDKVTGGSIELGGAEIATGTALLTVSDADISDDQIDNFKNAAGDYAVSTYLDIKLDQIFLKGSGDEYWNGAELDELTHEATVTIKLAKGVDGNTVVIVHEKHDGTYEVIPTTYNAKDHTITFKTSSFSNYAVASKTVDNANTRDKVIAYLVLFICSAATMVTLGVHTKKQKAKLNN